MTDDTITITEQATEAVARAQDEQSRTKAIEQAWNILLQAGVVTQEDVEMLQRRKRDRDLLALATDTLARAKALAADAVAVSISTSTLVYAAEDGESPRVFPRVTTTTTRRQKPKASEANEPKARANSEKVNGIPVEALRKASDQLGIKWFGPSNAARSKRVVELARQIAERGEA